MTHSPYNDNQAHHSLVVLPSDEAEAPKDIDQVRDLLFGTHQRENDRRLRGQERRTDEVFAAVKRLAERVDRDHGATFDLIREQYGQLQNQVNEQNRAFQERLREQQREFDQRLEAVQTTVAEMLESLDRAKLDQDDFADMLADVAVRLKRAR